jgi:hypothetical protein
MCWGTEHMALWRPRFPFIPFTPPFLCSTQEENPKPVDGYVSSTFTIEVYEIAGGGAPKWAKKYGSRYSPAPALFMDPSSLHIEGGNAPPALSPPPPIAHHPLGPTPHFCEGVLVAASTANNRWLVLRLRDGEQLGELTQGNLQSPSPGPKLRLPMPIGTIKSSRTTLFTPHHIICCAGLVIRGTSASRHAERSRFF